MNIPEKEGQATNQGRASLCAPVSLLFALALALAPKHERVCAIIVNSLPASAISPSKLLLHYSISSQTASGHPRAHSMSAIAAGYRISRRPRVLDRLLSSVL